MVIPLQETKQLQTPPGNNGLQAKSSHKTPLGTSGIDPKTITHKKENIVEVCGFTAKNPLIKKNPGLRAMGGRVGSSANRKQAGPQGTSWNMGSHLKTGGGCAQSGVHMQDKQNHPGNIPFPDTFGFLHGRGLEFLGCCFQGHAQTRPRLAHPSFTFIVGFGNKNESEGKMGSVWAAQTGPEARKKEMSGPLWNESTD